MKKFLSIACLILLCTNLLSQVTIGSNENPNAGALLDLKMNNGKNVNSSKGLGLPRVELKNIRTEKDLGKTMGAAQDNTLEHLDHIGLVVYNTGMNIESEETRFCPGIHVWDGEKWQPFVPYPEIRTLKGDYISYKRGFEFLDPNNPKGWPRDKEEARANGYYQLGRIVNTDKSSPNGTEDITDQRPGETSTNTYTVSRFYVGYKLLMEGYQIKKSFSCSTEDPNWDEIAFLPEVYIDITKVFDEGVWMTQNLRTTRFTNGTALIKQTSSNYTKLSEPHYYIPNNASSVTTNYGVLYNRAAAIGVGTPTGPATLPVNVEEGGSTNRDVMYQGICPDGWYLPSDQEWTDLANGVANNVSMFSGVSSSSVSNVDFDSGLGVAVGGSIGQAMKSRTAVSSTTGGLSNTFSAGGFDAYLVGTSGSTTIVYEYGTAAYFWASSSKISSVNYPLGYMRAFYRGHSNYSRDYHDAEQTFSVRCKKDTK